MNLTQISHRIEIAFWTTWVAALRSPRLGRLALTGLLAAACVLVIVLSTAWLLPPAAPTHVRAAESAQPAGAAPRLPAARPANGQRNLLVIVVADLAAARPVLISVWLLASLPDPAQVTFLPVYPAQDPQMPDFKLRLKAALPPGETGVLPTEFEQALQVQGLWWDHYWIVDAAGLAQIVERIRQVDSAAGQALAEQAATRLDGPAALAYQLEIAQQTCANAADLQRDTVSPAAAAALEQHTHSDLTLPQLRRLLRSLLGSEGLVCQFPVQIGR